jgi:hypothetical protein
MSVPANFTPEQEKELKRFRGDLWKLILLSSGIDVVISVFGIELALPTFGGSILIDELIEYMVSGLLARNKMRLKKRYKIAGFIPIPGVTSLSIQAAVELFASYRRPEKMIEMIHKNQLP